MSISEPQRSRVFLSTLVLLRPWASLPILLKNSTASPSTTTAMTTTIKNQAKNTSHLRAQIRIDRVDADNVSLIASTKRGPLHNCITWGRFVAPPLPAPLFQHGVIDIGFLVHGSGAYGVFFLFRFSASHRPYLRKGHGDSYLDLMAFEHNIVAFFVQRHLYGKGMHGLRADAVRA